MTVEEMDKEDGPSKPQLVDTNVRIIHTNNASKFDKKERVSQRDQKAADLIEKALPMNGNKHGTHDATQVSKRDTDIVSVLPKGEKKERIEMDLIAGEVEEYVFKMIRSTRRQITSTKSYA